MKGSLKQKLNTEKAAGIICTLPFTIGFLFFMMIPMAISLYYAFCEYTILTPAKFTGVSNLIKLVNDDTYWQSLRVTLKFAFISVPLRLVFALIVALLLFRSSKLTGFYRVIYYLPSILGGSVAISILWKRMFATDGLINAALVGMGIKSAEGFSWLGNEKSALWTLIILAVWQFGSSMLIFLAALKQIPTSLYEAAQVDGANPISKFFRITLPLLTPNIHFNLVMQMINGFLAFTQCQIITQGKPMNSTLFYTVYMYEQSFLHGNAGYGACMAWVMLILIALFTAFLFGTKKYWVYEGGF